MSLKTTAPKGSSFVEITTRLPEESREPNDQRLPCARSSLDDQVLFEERALDGLRHAELPSRYSYPGCHSESGPLARLADGESLGDAATYEMI
jgi:hypothetical protein